ncbi:Oidioi.mRNA.OKI2018_I69.chr2.g6908.t1.cds [Oikopleura dioica]|uniref:Oidioi.mRNA.OKI2018_I69.chr2.g6908.t1.cds n=1 Tax=Oikopleura dioica TaxID=34765 RepID=A0ABN7T808_OIKDI|nr:Oidioi.mRNA.OKI2018_I69.chr2.g6908.t1.cds [Oikopleura dioica]
MTIIEEELKRAKKWKSELDTTKKSRDADDFRKLQKRYRTLIRKQDGLLRIGLYLLLNLSENPDVQFKMRIKGIIKTLVEVIITRQAEPVLILALSMLQRMSVFKENKDEMKKQKVAGAVLPIVSDPKANDTLNLTLRLLMNLSFDKVIRAQIAASHLIPPIAKLASAIETTPQRQVARCLLYQISKDEKPRNQLSYTDAFPLLVTQVLNDRGEVPLELSALLINCALSPANAELLLKHNKGKTLKSLIKRGLKTKDALILKAIRNLSIHETGCKEAMLPYIGNIASNCQSTDESFAIECIGTLANLNLPNIDYNLVLQEYDLVTWLKNALDTNTTLPDDIVLEAVLLTGTAAMDDQCAKLLGKENFVQILIDLLKAKQEDDEMVCQIVYVFYQLAFHQVTRDQFLATTAPAYLVDLMHDSNAQVRLEKFRWHNSQWLEMIEGPQEGALAYEEEEYGHPADLLLYDNDEYFMDDEDQQMPPDFYPDFRPQSRWENSADPGWYNDGMMAHDYR